MSALAPPSHTKTACRLGFLRQEGRVSPRSRQISPPPVSCVAVSGSIGDDSLVFTCNGCGRLDAERFIGGFLCPRCRAEIPDRRGRELTARRMRACDECGEAFTPLSRPSRRFCSSGARVAFDLAEQLTTIAAGRRQRRRRLACSDLLLERSSRGVRPC
jgi:hypothetical protein